MAVKIYPYKQGSRSAHALADALGGRVLRREGSRYRYREQDLIINWGQSVAPPFPFAHDTYLNSIAAVQCASNKLGAFGRMRDGGVQIPQFWTRQEDIPDEAFPIVCRTILNGHSGAGIVIASNRAELVAAPLYVKYMKKRDEYRIHVGMVGERNGYPYAEGGDVPFPTIISIQRKAVRNGNPPIDTRIRNHDNGYVFVRGDVNPPEQVLEQARLQ